MALRSATQGVMPHKIEIKKKKSGNVSKPFSGRIEPIPVAYTIRRLLYYHILKIIKLLTFMIYIYSKVKMFNQSHYKSLGDYSQRAAELCVNIVLDEFI